jgi:hypothetical protein
MVALVIPDAAKAALSGAKTVRVPVDKAEAKPALSTACFSRLKLASLLTISAMFLGAGAGSSLEQEARLPEITNPEAITRKALLSCFIIFMFIRFM